MTSVEKWTVKASATKAQRYIYSKQSGGSKRKLVPAGKTVTVVQKPSDSERYKVKYGSYTGWMASAALEYELSLTLPETPAGIESAEASWAVGEQLFVIYEETRTERDVTVHARHISYLLLGDLTTFSQSGEISLQDALDGILSNCLTEHDFRAHTDMADTRVGVDWTLVNPISAMLDPDTGVLARWGCELVRDDFDLYFLSHAGMDRGVRIEAGKNLLGVNCEISDADAITRIVPTGENKDGSLLYLDGTKYVDSPNIGNYAAPHVYHLKCTDCKVGTDGVTAAIARQRMREQAQAMFDAGCDMPAVNLRVEHIDLGDTEEYAQYRGLERLYVYDTAGVYAPNVGLDMKPKVVRTKWDCLAERRLETELGTLKSVVASVASYQIRGVSGGKIHAGTVGSSALGEDIVGARHVQSESITAEKIAANAVTTGKVEAGAITADKIRAGAVTAEKLDAETVNAQIVSAVTAHLDQVIAGEITTDELYAAIAEITRLSVGELEVDAAQIRDLEAAVITAVQAKIDRIIAGQLTADEFYASLAEIGVMRAQQVTADNVTADELAAAYAEIVALLVDNISADNIETDRLGAALARFVTLHAGTAEFDFATIQNLVAQALSLEQASADSVYIKNLAVTSANLLSATIGKLVLRGDDGKYYAVFVGADGTIHTGEVTVTDAEISAGQTDSGRQIVETDMNVAGLNATNIQASSAVINSILTTALSAGSITAGDALIASATIPALYATSIKSIGDSLDLSANESLHIYVQGETEPLGDSIQQNYSDLKAQIDAQAGALAEAADQGAANAGEVAALTERIAGIEIEQGKINLGFETRILSVEEAGSATSGELELIKRGVRVEESDESGVTVTIYASDQSSKLQATTSGLAILPAGGGEALAEFGVTGASVPRLQVSDRIMLGDAIAMVMHADGTVSIMAANP